MKNKLTNNIGWKIISLLASVVLWIVVNSISNPTVTQSFYNIPVQLTNTNTITDAGKLYEVLDGSDVINRVTLRAPLSVIKSLTSSDIVAVADVKDLSSMDTVSIQLSTRVYNDQISSIKSSIDTVKLNIENKKTKTLALTTNVIGTLGKGYMVGDIKTEQNMIRISGSESQIESVVKAVIEVDVSGFTSAVKTTSEVKLLDADGNVVNNSRITQNLKYVDVSVDILNTKEVPVLFELQGEPAAGYATTGVVELSKDTVKICGKAEELRKIEDIKIQSDAVDISEQKSDYTVKVNITDYLPNGVTLVDNLEAIYEIKIYIEAETVKHIELEASDVIVVNLPEGYKASVSLADDSVVELIGLAADLSTANKGNILPTVDVAVFMARKGMETLEEGTYTSDLLFFLPSNHIRVADPITSVITFTKEKGETEAEE